MVRFFCLIGLFLFQIGLPACSQPSSPNQDRTYDWPDFRGEFRDGIWRESGILSKFPSEGLPVRWSVPVGPGYSGPTVANGRVYVTDRLLSPVPDEGILCFDEETGKKLWEVRYPCEYAGVGYEAGPRTSVVIREGKAYSLGTMGHLYCLDATSGEVLWNRDLYSEYEIRMPIWGIAATPLISGDMIYLQISGSNGACVVALNRHTGAEIWRSLDDMASYSTPEIIEKNGNRVLVVWTEDHLAGLDTETGHTFWKIPWKIGMGMAVASPVLYNDHIFVSAFFDGSMLVKLSVDYLSAEIAWQRKGRNERNTDALHSTMNTALIRDGFIYGVDSYGELRCLRFDNGDRVWEDLSAVKKDRWANIHFTHHGDHTWLFNEHGELIIARFTPDGYHEISRTRVIEPTREQLPRGVTWSMPAFANRHVFVRNDKELKKVSVAK